MSVNTRFGLDSDGWLYPIHSVEGGLSGWRNESKREVIVDRRFFENADKMDDCLEDWAKRKEAYEGLLRQHGNDPELDTLVEMLDLQEFHSSKPRR